MEKNIEKNALHITMQNALSPLLLTQSVNKMKLMLGPIQQISLGSNEGSYMCSVWWIPTNKSKSAMLLMNRWKYVVYLFCLKRVRWERERDFFQIYRKSICSKLIHLLTAYCNANAFLQKFNAFFQKKL